MHEKEEVKTAACCAQQDLAKSADLVPLEVETRGIRETYWLYVSVSIHLQSQPLHPPESSDFTGKKLDH